MALAATWQFLITVNTVQPSTTAPALPTYGAELEGCGGCRRAAPIIQQHWRPHFQRRAAAACTIQRTVRGLLARRALARAMAAATRIQVSSALHSVGAKAELGCMRLKAPCATNQATWRASSAPAKEVDIQTRRVCSTHHLMIDYSHAPGVQAAWRAARARRRAGPAARAIRARIAAAAATAVGNPQLQMGAVAQSALATIMQHADLPTAASLSEVGCNPKPCKIPLNPLPQPITKYSLCLATNVVSQRKCRPACCCNVGVASATRASRT